MSKTILLFPGQGSQFVGMAKKISEEFSSARRLLQEADDVLGFSLSRIMFEGPEADLKSTENTQPALYVHSMMVMEALRQEAVAFDFVAGHSLGEYSAICAAQGFSFADGLRLVRTRGELMAAAGVQKPGAMSAVIGMESAVLEQELASARATGIVVCANFNCPGQIVISGSREGVAKAGEILLAKGIKVVSLPVSGAFHSPLMEYALPGLSAAVAKVALSDLQVPLIANVTASKVQSAAQIKELLVKQLVSPVLWHQSMESAIAAGVSLGLEVGTGKVLMGLMRKISREIKVHTIEDMDGLRAFKG